MKRKQPKVADELKPVLMWAGYDVDDFDHDPLRWFPFNVYLTRREAVDAGELEIHRVRIVPVRRKARKVRK